MQLVPVAEKPGAGLMRGRETGLRSWSEGDPALGPKFQRIMEAHGASFVEQARNDPHSIGHRIDAYQRGMYAIGRGALAALLQAARNTYSITRFHFSPRLKLFG